MLEGKENTPTASAGAAQIQDPKVITTSTAAPIKDPKVLASAGAAQAQNPEKVETRRNHG